MQNNTCPNCNNSFPPGGATCPACTPQNPAAPNMYVPQPMPSTYFPPQPAVDVMSIWDYVWPYLLNFVPCVGGIVWLVFMFIWSFSRDTGPNRRNYARANLIITAVGLAISIIMLVAFYSSMFYIMQSLFQYAGYSGAYY